MSQTHRQSASGTSRASLYEEVTGRIVRELERGCVPWVKPWAASSAPLGMPRGAVSRRIYSGINVLILWDAVIRRGFASQEWLTFRQALSVGGHVKKGEKGTAICYADRFIPKAEHERARGEAERTSRDRSDVRPNGDASEPKSVPFLKRFIVFNVEQCDGLPAHIVTPPAPHPGTDIWREGDGLATATGAVIREGGGEAYYNPREDFIRIPSGAAFPSAADYFCTLFHELGHWTAHPSRLNRDLRHRFGSSALVAELDARGFAIVEEPGRRIVREQLESGGDALPWANMAKFTELAASRSIENMAAAARTGRLTFFDRGLVDAVCAFARLMLPMPPHLANAVRRYRYHSRVFLAPPWREIFAGDAERRHGFAGALAEYEYLADVFPRLGYETILLPKASVAARADFVLGKLPA